MIPPTTCTEVKKALFYDWCVSERKEITRIIAIWQIPLTNNFLEFLGILPKISAYPIVGKSLTIYKLYTESEIENELKMITKKK